MQTILSYIKKNKWFFGVRAEESLFFYSAKYLNRAKLTRKYYASNFVETLLFPLKNDYPVRVFNLAQAKKFHQESLTKIKRNSKILVKFIERDNNNWQTIDQLIGELKKSLHSGSLPKSKLLFVKLLEKYGVYGNLFFIVFSQGMVLTKNQQEVKGPVAAILKVHDQWRNSVAFKEEKIGQAFFEYLNNFVNNANLDLSPKDLMKYLTAVEILRMIVGKLPGPEIKEIIAARKNNGYIYTFLHNIKYQGVIDNGAIIAQTREYFQNKLAEKNQHADILTGMTAFEFKKKIRGKVVVIKDKNELAQNKISLVDKILVAIQTTPHFIPYIKKVKAIITDEGGVTCHAAIVAREFQIPCLVGVKNATQNLHNNDLVEIDTKQGTIKRI